jgi:peptidoglycan/LPS O-acetylase OafA/YrhL
MASSTITEIPSLYGIRGIAALAVVFSHILPGQGELGRYAVTCFFVLSGYLITHLMLKEQTRTGTVSLRNFYWRRSLRILPAAFVFLVAVAVLSPLDGREIPWASILAAGLYVTNYFMIFGGYSGGVGHTWW